MGLHRFNIIICLFCCQLAFAEGSRDCVIVEGQKLLGVVERKANDSPEIRLILKNAGLDSPDMYCSATVKWIFDVCGIMTTISAYSPTAVPEEKAVWKGGKVITRDPLPADVFGIYSPRKGRISHAGIIFNWPAEGDYFLSIEGNVGVGDGKQGITILRRKKSDIHIIVNWIEDVEVREKIAEAEIEVEEIDVTTVDKATVESPPNNIGTFLLIFLCGYLLFKYGNK